jgi:hypothetical protein
MAAIPFEWHLKMVFPIILSFSFLSATHTAQASVNALFYKSYTSSRIYKLDIFIKLFDKHVVLNRESSVGIATAYWLNGQGSIPCRDKRVPLLHSGQTGSGALASCNKGSGTSFSAGKKAGS